MSEFTIRRGTRADDLFFFEMEFETTWANLSPEDRRFLTPDMVREALRETHELLLSRPGTVIFIAENELKERVGLLWFGANRNLVTGQDEAWVFNVSVVPACRGRGVGRLLMEHAEAYARKTGYLVLGLMVSVHNPVARTLYEKLGFEDSNVLMRKPLE